LYAAVNSDFILILVNFDFIFCNSDFDFILSTTYYYVSFHWRCMYVCYVLLNSTYLKTKKWKNMKIKTDMVKNIDKSPGSQWSQSRRRKKARMGRICGKKKVLILE